MQHERIVRLFFHFEDRHFMYLGMEFCQGGSLFDKLQKAERFDAPVAARCEALDYLHHLPEKVIHRDIKPENILLTADDSVKLADFGWANLLEAATQCESCDQRSAEEMIKGTGHDESVDMWTMGVLLYELLTGQSPFGSSSKDQECRMRRSKRNVVFRRKAPVDRLKVRDAMAHSFITRHLQTEQGDAAGYPEAKGAVVKGVTETGDMSPSRPSVVARKLRAECERSLVEKDGERWVLRGR
eukprot:g17834.t1